MGSKTRLSSYCTKRANNGVNLVTSRKINTRLARPINRQDNGNTNIPPQHRQDPHRQLDITIMTFQEID